MQNNGILMKFLIKIHKKHKHTNKKMLNWIYKMRQNTKNS